MSIESVTLTISTHGPTIQQQLEAIQKRRLLEKALATAAEFDRQLREIDRIMTEWDQKPKKRARDE